MAITVTENPDSRTVSRDRAEFIYTARGSSDPVAIKAAVLIAAPGTFDGKVRDDASPEPVHVDEGTQTDCIWTVTVSYLLPEDQQKEVGESSFSFDTTGGTQHVTQSISTASNYAPPGQTAPDFKGAIGVTKDTVEGVDITVPVYQFSETHVLADATVTATYKGTLFSLTGRINDAAFKGLAAGECMFLGASGAKRGDGDWEITFKFAGSPNKTGLTVGTITGIDKKGWQYLWVRYEDTEDTAAKVVVKRPKSVHVENMCYDGDFSQLGIGT